MTTTPPPDQGRSGREAHAGPAVEAAVPATGVVESYQGLRQVLDQVRLPDAAACERALGRGGECGLYVERGGPWVLMVGGGPERFQVCLWDTEADQGYEADDPGAEPGATVDLVTGGQGVVLPLGETVDRAAALAALLAFVERGERAAEVTWVANG
jgi:hypothetical protein